MSIPAETPAAVNDVALVNEAGCPPGLDGTVDRQEVVEVVLVGGCRPALEQSGVGQNQRPGAHRGRQACPLVDRAHLGTPLVVTDLGASAQTPRIHEHVDLGTETREWSARTLSPLAHLIGAELSRATVKTSTSSSGWLLDQ
jgi:hypothetical protein